MIRPDQAADLSPQDLAFVEAMEKLISAELADGERFFPLKHVGWNRHTEAEIIARGRAAGWKVEKKFSMGDDDYECYLEFSKP